MTGAELDHLAARFEAAAIPRPEWTHHAHLLIGAWYVERVGPSEALAQLRAGIRRLSDVHRRCDMQTSGYHETVTAAYVRLVSSFLARCPPTMSLADRIDALLASPVAGKQVLLRHYSRGLLMSPRARAEWVAPDRAPLPEA